MIKKQQGFSLIEFIITISIMGILAGVLGPFFDQVLDVPEYGNERITAMHELQNAAHRVNIDGQMAKSATGGSSLVLTMPDNSTISYTLNSGNFTRSSGCVNTILARNITYVSFTVDGRHVTMDITSSPEGRWDVSENKTYQICLRPVQKKG
jgi:prepilin-type N-terminal cleavage/methylation domain-containing protein